MQITEEGTIKRIEGQKAWVATHRSEACHQCEAKGMCHALGSGQEVEVLADNEAHAEPGDRVLLALDSRPLLSATFLIYMAPIIVLLIGAFIGNQMASQMHLSPDLASLLVGCVFFAIAFFFARRRGVALGSQKRYVPQVIQIIAGGSNGRSEQNSHCL